MGRVSVISNSWKQSKEVRNMADERFEFVAPDFVSGSNPEEIQERMMNNLPGQILMICRQDSLRFYYADSVGEIRAYSVPPC